MRIGILLPGFSQDETDWAIPIQQHLIGAMARNDTIRVIAMRYPHHRRSYRAAEAIVYPLGGAQTRGPGRLWLWARALITIRRLHEAQAFDVLHAMWADETGLIAGWAGRCLKIPVVVSVAGGELVHLPDIGYGLQGSVFSRWIVGQALHLADRVMVASRYSAGLIRRSRYPVPDTHITYLPLGVDANLFCPDSSTERRWHHLIHVGSLIPVKDQVTLLRAMTRLEQGVTLEVIGEGPERNRLQEQAAALGIEQRVTFAGTVSHPNLPARYQRAGLHILTSRHEGQGMVTLEAAACGLYSVGTAVGLLPDDPRLGNCVPVGDDAALAHAIEALLADPQRLKQSGDAARQAVDRQYRVEQTAEQLRKHYRDLARSAEN